MNKNCSTTPPTNRKGTDPMARQKAISVKIATPKVIKALEQALAKLELDYTSQEANEAKYQKQYEKWKKELFDYAVANIKKAENLRTNYRNWNNQLNIDFDLTVSDKDLPKEPVKDFEQISIYNYREQKEEISNAIRILKMTDEETVSTSTYQAVARYL
jgi:NADH dehydrogenase/NADH:ubiquinone oxidoreductase subunit G